MPRRRFLITRRRPASPFCPHAKTAPIRSGADGVPAGRNAMTDLWLVGLTVLFFAASIVFAELCERL